jgi:hypothetical protein
VLGRVSGITQLMMIESMSAPTTTVTINSDTKVVLTILKNITELVPPVMKYLPIPYRFSHDDHAFPSLLFHLLVRRMILFILRYTLL